MLEALWSASARAYGWLTANPESLLGSALVVWLISQIATIVSARSAQRRRLRHAAVALRTESELTRENLEAFIPGYWAMVDSLIEEPSRRFFVLADRRSQQTLESLRADLVLMPGQALKAVVAFYSLDARINQYVEALTQPVFLDRPPEKKVEILWTYADLFDQAVQAARRAEQELKLLAWRNGSRLSMRPYLFWPMLWRHRRRLRRPQPAPAKSALLRR